MTKIGFDKYRQRHRNKFNHIYNGNTTSNHQLRIIQINKGISKLHNVAEELLDMLSSKNADIANISEANYEETVSNSRTCVDNVLKNYNLESKSLEGTSNSRIVIIIKKRFLKVIERILWF